MKPPMQLSPRDKLLAHSAQVLNWLEEPAALLFSDWLKEVRVRENRQLMEAEVDWKVYRAQGSLGVIDLILSLQVDLRRYEMDVREGKCKKVEEAPDGLA